MGSNIKIELLVHEIFEEQVLRPQFSAHTNDILCKKKVVTLNLFFDENQKSEPLPPNFDPYNALPGNQLFEKLVLKTKVYQAFPFCFPPGSLDSPASPADSDKKMPNEYCLGAWRVWGAMGIFVPFSSPS